MNNLLRTLTESQFKPTGDLRLLLTTVKEGRRQTYDNNNKLTDPFYDSLEGLLVDLKTITIDNRDAEAFLKPVSRAEVPDYYDVIQNPMDFQTMLKKVKSKQYKSIREFKDDLDLIWSNCLTYNAAENHPLRPCVHRLKAKAERLLLYITDRKDRSDPRIPSEMGGSVAGIATRINGAHSRTHSYVNGRSHTRSSSSSSISRPGTITLPAFKGRRSDGASGAVDFGESPAILRTPEGMARFWDLEHAAGGSNLKQELRELMPLSMEMSPTPDEGDDDVDVKLEESSSSLGEKRKFQQNGERPRKKARFVAQVPVPTPLLGDGMDEVDEINQLWWGAVQSDTMMGNGLPGIPFGPSSSKPTKSRKSKFSTAATSAIPTASSTSVPSTTKPTKKVKKKLKTKPSDPAPVLPTNPKSLLSLMNNNIKTMRRVRHTHNKFAALNAATAPAEDEDGAGGAGIGGAGSGGAGAGVMAADGPGLGGGGGLGAGGPTGYTEEDVVEDAIDERPWMLMRGLVPSTTVPPTSPSTFSSSLPTLPSRATSKAAYQTSRGIDIGERSASDCLHWSTNKILEHAGFQGTSSVALDVLSDVMCEYLSNVGRMMRFLTDRFGSGVGAGGMTAEEIILHTLFESGSSKIQDMERYISDDIERYGVRLGELEKKLVGAYRETTAGEALEDEGLFDSEGEDETGALALGDFADLLGEDYLGFKELGLAEEFGMTNLTIPKRMLKRKKGANKPTALKPTEPPPPYPPPPAFVPLTAGKVDDQIGLLKPYYQSRFALLAANAPLPIPIAAAPPGPALAGPVLGGMVGGKLPGPSLPGPSLPGPTMPPPLQGPKLGANANTLPSMPASAPPTNGSTLPTMSATAPPIASNTLPSGVPGVSAPPMPMPTPTPIPMAFAPPNPDLPLPDDGPTPAQVRISPIGQIIKPGGAAGAAKKKAPPPKGGGDGGGAGGGGGGGAAHGAGGGAAGGGGPPTVVIPTAGPAVNGTPVPASAGGNGGDVDGQSPSKKRKLNTGVGTGNGRKKKPEGGGNGTAGLPPVVIASA